MQTDTFADAFMDTSASARCCAYVRAFVDASEDVDNVDVSANARQRIRECVCKFILSICS